MYRQGIWGNLGSGVSSRVSTHTSYEYAIIFATHGGQDHGRILQINFTNAKDPYNRVREIRSDYSNNYAIRGGTNEAFVLTRNVFNDMVSALNANQNPGSLSDLAKGHGKMQEMKDKPVFIVWNMTDGMFVRATVSAEEAEKLAFELAQKNPTKRYLTLRPDSIAYQPVSIKVEKVQV